MNRVSKKTKLAKDTTSYLKYHFVLVHGACHGAWCWYKLRTLLEASGHQVTCVDLKSCGADPTDFLAVETFEQYNEPLTTFMSNLPEDQKVVLVGHSIGGLNVTDVLYKFPQKVQLVVYIAANMMRRGYDFTGFFELFEHLFGDEIVNILIPKWDFINKPGTDEAAGMIVKPEFQRMVFYHMSPVEDSTLASMLLRPTPIKPLLKVTFDDGAVNVVESVPRVYVRTLDDQLMKQEFQDIMIRLWPPSKVYATGSDHSAYLSTPHELCRYLLEAATAFNKS